jgi:hypothetical protein
VHRLRWLCNLERSVVALTKYGIKSVRCNCIRVPIVYLVIVFGLSIYNFSNMLSIRPLVVVCNISRVFSIDFREYLFSRR